MPAKRVGILTGGGDVPGETLRGFDRHPALLVPVHHISDRGVRQRGHARTAVGFKTGPYTPDFHSIATESTIVLPWDREILIDGELVTNPLYAAVLGG